MNYRLGLDMGSNSIGWCVLDLDGNNHPAGIQDIGVRIFPDGRDPQSGASLAVDRRAARGHRRRRDRFLRRRTDLMGALVRHGLMPKAAAARKALESLDPYELRARALDELLTPQEVGRALFHLHQRRGFKSNRKTDTGDKEDGKIKSGVSKLRAAMAVNNARTLGEYLYQRHLNRNSVRARLNGTGAKAEYDLYPERAMVEEEFNAIWDAQTRLGSDVTGVPARAELHGIMFRQRPLKQVEPGRCTFNPDESRAPRALPLAQQFRIYQELANLRIRLGTYKERRLSVRERDLLAEHLFTHKDLTFKRVRTLLKLDPAVSFNLAGEKRDGLKGDETAAVLAHKDRFGKTWRAMDFDAQSRVVERLLDTEDEDELLSWLAGETGLDSDAAQAVATARLVEGHARLGRTALTKVVTGLREGETEASDPDTGEIFAAPPTYDQAVAAAGYHHSHFADTQQRKYLPYYGVVLDRHVAGTGGPNDPRETRHGRIANPTVHVGLNQLRRVVNAVIDLYGEPQQIVVELARELKMTHDQKERIQREQGENQKMNDARRALLVQLGEADTGENRMRLRLWEELGPIHDRRCVYTGEPISVERLFGSDVEVEHILPFGQTLDNSAANRTLAMRHANRAKGRRAPHDAFGESPTIAGYAFDWNGILSRADNLPDNKKWRFGPEAMERFAGERGFLDRQLTDTAYLSRISRQYLTVVCGDVSVTPGRLTGLLRGKWGLNALLSDHNHKNRVDHRHHAIDAFVVGLTDRDLLNRISRAADDTRERLIGDMPEPWEGFRKDLGSRLDTLVVSHRPDRGVQGKLHEETAYGLVRDPESEDGHNLVHRKAFTDLNKNEIARIRAPELRDAVLRAVADGEKAGLNAKQALAAFNEQRENKEGLPPIRRVRLLKKEAGVVRISDEAGCVYKTYSPGDNHCIEIFETGDGKWRGEVVTVFEANQEGTSPEWRRAFSEARLVMRVHKGDLLRITNGDNPEIFRVVRLEPSASRIRLAGHRESGDLQNRHDDKDDPFRWIFASYSRLREWRVRPVRVDEVGRVHAVEIPS